MLTPERTRPSARRLTVRPAPRGTAGIFLLVMLIAVATGLATAMAMTAGTEGQVAQQEFHRNATFYAAEAGLQRAQWLLLNQQTWPTQTNNQISGSVGACHYVVTATAGGPNGLFWNSPIILSSVGSDAYAHCTLTATANPTNSVPTFALGGDYYNSGTLFMQGDLSSLGNITTNGNLTVQGNLKAAGSISATGNANISGKIVPNATGITVPSVMAIYNQLSTSPQAETLSPDNVQTLDFTKYPIIVVNGSVDFSGSAPVAVIGSGTLVVNGNCVIQSAAALGTGSLTAPINIVTTGNFNIQGKLYINGSVYVAGTLTKGGAYGVTGVVVVGGSATNGGGDTFTRGQPPPFDPRASYTGGSGAVVLQNFTGPVF